MGSLASLGEVNEIMQRFAARVGFAEPNKQRAVAVFENCKDYGLETIRDAFSNFEKQEMKYFPRLGEIISKVKSISKRDVKFTELDGRCKYLDFEEEELSRKLCKKTVSADEANVSNLMHGEVYCAWHSQVANSKRNPKCSDAIYVRSILANLAKFSERGHQSSEDGPRAVSGSIFSRIST